MLKQWRVGLVLLLCLTFFMGCSQPKMVTPTEAKPQKPEIEVRGGSISVADATGTRVWQAQADLMQGDFLSGKGRMLGIKGNLLENEAKTITMQSDEATYQPKTREIILRGDVKADWPEEAARVQADKIIWSLDRQELIATGKVDFARGEEYLKGDHLQADFNLRKIDLTDGEGKR
jgi:LPS export ABC transporter protein LptC